jgi:hypothetical protein
MRRFKAGLRLFQHETTYKGDACSRTPISLFIIPVECRLLTKLQTRHTRSSSVITFSHNNEMNRKFNDARIPLALHGLFTATQLTGTATTRVALSPSQVSYRPHHRPSRNSLSFSDSIYLHKVTDEVQFFHVD